MSSDGLSRHNSFRSSSGERIFEQRVSDHQKRLVQAGLFEILGSNSGDSFAEMKSISGSSDASFFGLTNVTSELEEIRRGLDNDMIKMKNPDKSLMPKNLSPENIVQSASYANMTPSKTVAPLTHDISFLEEYMHLFTPGCQVCQVQFKHVYRDYTISAELLSNNHISIGEFLIVQSMVDPNQVDLGVLTKLYTVEAFYSWKRLRGRSQDHEENAVGRVIRVANQVERQLLPIKKARESPLLEACHRLTILHGINMKVYGVEYQFDGNVVFVYYTADTRVDYRAFVYDLLKESNHTRVKMKKTNQCRKFIPKEWAAAALSTGHNAKL